MAHGNDDILSVSDSTLRWVLAMNARGDELKFDFGLPQKLLKLR
jgi:hypothetical protein